MRNLTVFVGALAGLASCKAPLPNLPPATPQRPTVSSDTSTTPIDTLEVEIGAALDPGDRFDLPLLVKWGLGQRTELAFGWSIYEFEDRPGPSDAEGVGDLTIGIRHRVSDETEQLPAFAFNLMTKLPTGDDDNGLSSGEIDFFAAGIASKQIGDVATTAFYELGILGDPGVADTSVQHIVALAGGVQATERWGVFAEVAGVYRPEFDTEIGLLTLGASYALKPSIVLDAALVIGLSGDSPDLQILLGTTSNLGTQGVLGLFR